MKYPHRLDVGLASAAIAIAVLAMQLVAATPARADSCMTCHLGLRQPELRAPAEELQRSIHGDHDIGCSDCHGGRPDEDSVRAHDPRQGFRSALAAATVPEVCGNCHSEAANVDEGLPTDQLSSYRLSVHGRAALAGNDRAASCWSCHGAHLVLPARDPESRVFPGNVATTCGECHSSADVMLGTDLPRDQERQWTRSAHGRAFAEWLAGREPGTPVGEDERHPPTCSSCHGEHAISDPSDAVQGCAGCHEAQWETFEASPHKEAFERRGFLPCVECHGQHAVESADESLAGLNGRAACRRCHRRGQEMAEAIEGLATKNYDAEQAARTAMQTLAAADRAGAAPGDAVQLLDGIQDARHELRLAMHSLDEETVGAAAAALEAAAAQVTALGLDVPDEEAAEGEDFNIWPVAGTAAIVLAMLALLVAFGRRWGKKS